MTAAKLWPTPCAEDAKNVPYQKGKDGTRYPMLLGAVAPARMWPTPRAAEWKGTGPLGSSSHQYRLAKGYLDATVQTQSRSLDN